MSRGIGEGSGPARRGPLREDSILVNDDRDQRGRSTESTLRPDLGQAPHSVPIKRHSYAPPAGRRRVALIGTCSIYTTVLAGFLITVNDVAPVHKPSAPIVVELRQIASPPETPPQEKEALKPVEKKETSPEPPKVQPVERAIVPFSAVAVPIPVMTPQPVDPTPKEPETAAPKTTPAPPAPSAASDAPDTWESKVLAQLNKHRRYPRMA